MPTIILITLGAISSIVTVGTIVWATGRAQGIVMTRLADIERRLDQIEAELGRLGFVLRDGIKVRRG